MERSSGLQHTRDLKGRGRKVERGTKEGMPVGFVGGGRGEGEGCHGKDLRKPPSESACKKWREHITMRFKAGRVAVRGGRKVNAWEDMRSARSYGRANTHPKILLTNNLR